MWDYANAVQRLKPRVLLGTAKKQFETKPGQIPDATVWEKSDFGRLRHPPQEASCEVFDTNEV